jgi:hypothetical protein
MDAPLPGPDDGPPLLLPRDAFDPDGSEQVVRLGDSGDLAAALPVLVGFRPRESVVLVALGGKSGRRVGLTARIDIPPPEHARTVAQALARRLDHEEPDATVLAVVSEADDVAPLHDDPDEVFAQPVDLPHRPVVHEILMALDAFGIPLREALLVRRGRWWSYDCAEICCAPGAGTPVPAGTSPLAAASVAAGQVVARDREELVRRIQPSEPSEAATMADAIMRVGDQLAELVLTNGRDGAAERYAAWVDAAVAGCHSPGNRPTDEEVARVVWGLRDVRVRDRALGFALGSSVVAAEQLWTQCTRRAPTPLDAAPATLLAVTAWLRGDGAMARIALDRALDSEPDYALAGLLSRGLDAGLSPRDLRGMVQETQADLGNPWALPTFPDAPVRATRAAATARRGRARPGTRSRSRTRRRRFPE